MNRYLNTFIKINEDVLLFQMKRNNSGFIILGDPKVKTYFTSMHVLYMWGGNQVPMAIEIEEARRLSKKDEWNKNVFEAFQYFHLSIEKLEDTRFRNITKPP